MGSRSVRQGANQSRWNASGENIYLWHFWGVAALAGVLFQSWWAFLIVAVLMNLLCETQLGRFVVLGCMAMPWGVLAGGTAIEIFGPDGVVVGLLVFGGIYAGISAGHQYYSDIGKTHN